MGKPGRVTVVAFLTVTAASACAGGSALPNPRSLIVYSGERVQADPERMAEVEEWLMPQLERIDLDPDFLIRLEEFETPTYPWETLEIEGDTVSVGLLPVAPDAETPYLIYGYLQLMNEWDTLGSVLAEGRDTSGYDTERAIVSRVADVWLLGRSVFDTQPYGPLDELVYAKYFGYLDEFIFATQGERFPEAADAYRSSNPGSDAEFRDWFQQTFEADGPQYVLEPGEESESTDQARAARDPEGWMSWTPGWSVLGEAQLPGT